MVFQLIRCAALGAALMWGGAAYAQTAPTIDPGRLQKRFEAPRGAASVLQAPHIIQGDDGEVQPLDDSITFTLNALHLSGNAHFSDAELAPLFAHYVGQEIALPVLQEIVAEITRFYRNEGYLLSQAVLPPQEIDGGSVRIDVLEGFVGEVRPENGENIQTPTMQKYIARILESKPLHFDVLERYLLLMDDLVGIKVRGTLVPSETVEGASVLVLAFDKSAYQANASIDNRGSRFLGPLQGSLSLSRQNPFDHYANYSARLIGTLNWEELKYTAISYAQPVGGDGMQLSTSISHALTAPGAGLRSLDIEGKSTTIDIGATYPAIRSRQENLYISLTGTWRESQSETLGVNVFEDHVRTASLDVQYDSADSARGINQLGFTFTKGFEIFGANDADDLVSRSNADAAFHKIEFNAARYQALENGWSIRLSSKGQFAFDPLFSSEEFDVGGQQFGGAYDASEITGEHGLAARAELQNTLSDFPNWLNYMQLYGFYDMGVAWNDDVLIGEEKRSSITSMGAGARFGLPQGVVGGVELAAPLTRHVSSEGSGGDDLRLFFTLSYSLQH